jgi:hypothetical protein
MIQFVMYVHTYRCKKKCALYLSDQVASVSSPLLWYTNSPPAHSSVLLRGVTQIFFTYQNKTYYIFVADMCS